MSTVKRNQRGSMSLFAVVVVVAMIVIVGLVVDGGARLHAAQQADDVAREAARAAGQAVQSGSAVRGTAVMTDAAAARQAARAYLAAAGVNGSVSVTNVTVHVSADQTYTPIFLSIIGIGPATVTGHADARIVRVVAGQEH